MEKRLTNRERIKRVEYASLYGVIKPDFVCFQMKRDPAFDPNHRGEIICKDCAGTGIAAVPVREINIDVLVEIVPND